MSLSDDRLREMLTAARKANPHPWKVWGMSVLADPVGDSNISMAQRVADTHFENEDGRLRTFDADHIANMDPPTSTRLLTEVLHLREVVRRAADPATSERVRHALLAASAMATPIAWGRPGAIGPISYAGLTGTIRIPGKDGVQTLSPDGVGWEPAEPLPMQGWKAKAEERFRGHGWTRLANFMARWDERGLGG